MYLTQWLYLLLLFYLSFSFHFPFFLKRYVRDVQSQTHVIMFDDVSFYIHMENKRCYKCLAIVGYFDNVTILGKGSWIYALKHMAHPTHLAIVHNFCVWNNSQNFELSHIREISDKGTLQQYNNCPWKWVLVTLK